MIRRPPRSTRTDTLIPFRRSADLLDILREFYAELALPLDHILRTIVGMDPEAVRSRFSEFAHRYPALSAKQTQFLSMLQNHIAKYGAIELDRLWERPLTLVDPAGVVGVFTTEPKNSALLAFTGPKQEKRREG